MIPQPNPQSSERALASLRQSWGPFESEWRLFVDRLDIVSNGPTGTRTTTVDLTQIDTLGAYEEAPRILLAAAGLLLACLTWMLLGGLSGGLLWLGFFMAAVATGFLIRGVDLLRVPWIEVETVGGRRFRLLGLLPSRREAQDFLRLLRQCRTQAIAGLQGGWQLEDGDFLEDLGEGDGGHQDEGPIDPRWIN